MYAYNKAYSPTCYLKGILSFVKWDVQLTEWVLSTPFLFVGCKYQDELTIQSTDSFVSVCGKMLHLEFREAAFSY